MSRLLLGLLLALAPLATASGFDEVHAARAFGSITIDERGAVLDVVLDAGKLGDEVDAGLVEQIRGWRFEPVLEQGQPTQARLRLTADLLAFRKRGTPGRALAVSRAWLVEQTDGPEAGPRRESAPPIAQPAYPRDAATMGIGADVVVLVRMGENGKVADAAVASLMLTGERAGVPRLRERQAAMFARSATEVAGRWRFPWAKAGEILKVPVRYTPPGFDGRRWVRAFPVGMAASDWALQAQAGDPPPRMVYAGQEAPGRTRLLTRLESIPPVLLAD